jgi:hypothetical protein
MAAILARVMPGANSKMGIERKAKRPLYCMCQAKERRVSQARQLGPGALRTVPEMDLHVRFAPQEDPYRQRLGLRPDIHF